MSSITTCSSTLEMFVQAETAQMLSLGPELSSQSNAGGTTNNGAGNPHRPCKKHSPKPALNSNETSGRTWFPIVGLVGGSLCHED